MLISCRDSKKYPSGPLALQVWGRVAEAVARQVVWRGKLGPEYSVSPLQGSGYVWGQ